MAESEGITKGIGGLLGKTTAGLPNWAWLLVIAGGIAAAVFLPKLFGGSSSTDTSSTDGSTTAPTDVLPPGVPIGGYGGGDGSGGGGVGIMPPIMPPSPVGPPLPDCSLEHSCAQPPVNGKCPPGMHVSKDGLCRCNAKGMVNWGTVCLPPGQIPPGYAATTTNPPTSTTTAVAGQEASTATATSKLQEQNDLRIMPPIKAKGSPPPLHGKPIVKGDDDIRIMPPIKVTPRWPNKEEE